MNTNINGNAITIPPPLYTRFDWPSNACPYYRTAYKRKSKTFTEKDHHGNIYRPLYEKLRGCFLQSSEENCNHLPPSHPFFRMIPSFFHTLVKLKELKRNYILVLRTFGSDLEDIAMALTDFAQGKHPLFPNFHEPKLVLKDENLFCGRYVQSDGDDDSGVNGYVYNLYSLGNDSHEQKTVNDEDPVASGDDQVLNMIENLSVCGIQDDYHHWDRHQNSPTAGKPCWIHFPTTSTNDSSWYHHLFFDDNIHNDANDSIVAVRRRGRGCNKNDDSGNDGDVHDQSWHPLDGQATIEQQGKYVIRVATVSAILDHDYFLKQIHLAEDLVRK